MWYLLIAYIVFMLAACCKVYCEGNELAVSFRKFRATETDTVLFVRYQPQTGFSRVIDSMPVFSVVPPADTSFSTLTHFISSSYDWKVFIPAVNRQFLFEKFQLTNEKCNCGGTKYKAISSFQLNGVSKKGLWVELQ